MNTVMSPRRINCDATELAGIRDAPLHATALRQIRDATMPGTNVSQSSIADLFWPIGQLDTESSACSTSGFTRRGLMWKR